MTFVVRLLRTMNYFSNLLKWLLYTSIFAGLCAVGLCMATERLLLAGLPGHLFSLRLLSSPLHGFVFANTLFIYNVHYGIKKLPPGLSDRADWSAKYRRVHYILIVTAALMSGTLLLFLNLKILWASLFLGVLSLAYSLPVLPFKNKKRLKDFGLLKLVLLCFVWACVTTLLPILYWGKSFESYEVDFLLRFTLMIPLCVAFDIRDMQVDKDNRIFTLPNTIGVQNSYYLVDISLLVFIALAVWQYLRYPIPNRLISAVMIAAITKVIITFSKRYNSDLYHLLLIDGVMLLYALLILI